MPSRVWSHLSDYAMIDASGKASIIGEFDLIYAATLPAQHPMLFVTSKWIGFENESFTHQVRITSPSKKEVSKGPRSTIIMQTRPGAHDSMHINFDAFLLTSFEEYGEYAIDIIVNNDVVHILPLSIVRPIKAS